jgi:integrase
MVSAIISHANERERVLYALLAGTGLRIGEALGLEVQKHISPDCLSIDIQQSLWHSTTQLPKTRNAIRKVHLCSDLAKFVKAFIGNRTIGFLFRNESGNPLYQRNVLGRSLHPILEKKLKVEIQGFHGFRRFRLTLLRKNRVPGDLERFWMGHSDQEIGDLYSKMEDDAGFCQTVAESVGLGFNLPNEKVVEECDVAPIAPKTVLQGSIR